MVQNWFVLELDANDASLLAQFQSSGSIVLLMTVTSITDYKCLPQDTPPHKSPIVFAPCVTTLLTYWAVAKVRFYRRPPLLWHLECYNSSISGTRDPGKNIGAPKSLVVQVLWKQHLLYDAYASMRNNFSTK